MKLLDNIEQGLNHFLTSALKILLFKAWSPDQENHHHLELVREAESRVSIPDLLDQNTPFNKIPRWLLLIFRISSISRRIYSFIEQKQLWKTDSALCARFALARLGSNRTPRDIGAGAAEGNLVIGWSDHVTGAGPLLLPDWLSWILTDRAGAGQSPDGEARAGARSHESASARARAAGLSPEPSEGAGALLLR